MRLSKLLLWMYMLKAFLKNAMVYMLFMLVVAVMVFIDLWWLLTGKKIDLMVVFNKIVTPSALYKLIDVI